MDCDAALDWLFERQLHGIRLGLTPMRRLCDTLGIRTESDEQCSFIHVAGTNGKGSVCAMLAAMLSASGQRTGLYTSPHLVHFRERIRLGSECIPDAHIASGLSRIRDAVESWDPGPTFFEITTALALDWFQRQKARWVVLETGMGGRLDATNIITPLVSVLTPIGLDHQAYLGSTLTEIAGEKAGILKAGVPAVSAAQTEEAERVFREKADALGISLRFITEPIGPQFNLGLAGTHQRHNAALAFAALITAGLRPDPKDIANALAMVQWPGRFQRVENGRIVLDGAHNPHAAERLATTWREEYGDEKPIIILGMLADKDAASFCQTVAPFAARIICIPVNNPRTLSAEELRALLPRATASETAANLSTALASTHDASRVLITGSLYLVGEALSELGIEAPQDRPSSQ